MINERALQKWACNMAISIGKVLAEQQEKIDDLEDRLKELEGEKVMIRHLIDDVIVWFHERNIAKGNGDGQVKKLLEEVYEFQEAHENSNDFEAKDGIGDIMVVLIGYCLQRGWTIEECLQQAYDEIKTRQGHVNDEGIFVKECKDGQCKV